MRHTVARRLPFCGDFVYPGDRYAFLPGAGCGAYLATTERLLAMLDPATPLLAAHPDDGATVTAAPRLGVADLRALSVALRTIDAGTLHADNFYPRLFPMNAAMRFATGPPWNNR